MDKNQVVIFNSDDGGIGINVQFDGDTVWLTQKAMAELFDVNPPAISKHLNNIFAEGELVREATVSKMEMVQTEGVRQVNVKKAYLESINDIYHQAKIASKKK